MMIGRMLGPCWAQLKVSDRDPPKSFVNPISHTAYNTAFQHVLTELAPCTDQQMEEFPERMRSWLYLVMEELVSHPPPLPN